MTEPFKHWCTHCGALCELHDKTFIRYEATTGKSYRTGSVWVRCPNDNVKLTNGPHDVYREWPHTFKAFDYTPEKYEYDFYVPPPPPLIVPGPPVPTPQPGCCRVGCFFLLLGIIAFVIGTGVILLATGKQLVIV